MNKIKKIEEFSGDLVAYQDSDDHWGFLNEVGEVVIETQNIVDIFVDKYTYSNNQGSSNKRYIDGIVGIVIDNGRNCDYSAIYINKDGKVLGGSEYKVDESTCHGYNKKDSLYTSNIIDGYAFFYKRKRFLPYDTLYAVNSSGTIFEIGPIHRFSVPENDIVYSDSNRYYFTNGFIFNNFDKNNMLFLPDKGNSFRKIKGNGVTKVFIDTSRISGKVTQIYGVSEFTYNENDKKYYAIIKYKMIHDKTIRSGFIDEDGKVIPSFGRYDVPNFISILNNKYYLSEYNNKSQLIKIKDGFHRPVYDFIFDDINCKVEAINEIESGIYLFKNCNSDKYFIFDSNNLRRTYEFDEYINEENDYYVVFDNNKYKYYSKDFKLLFESNNRATVKNNNLVFYTEEPSEESNDLIMHRKYYMCKRSNKNGSLDLLKDIENSIKCIYPSDKTSVRLRDVLVTDNIIFGFDQFSKTIYIINTDDMSISKNIEYDSYEFINNYLIVFHDNKYSLYDDFGVCLYKDCSCIKNIGNDTLYISNNEEEFFFGVKNSFRIGEYISNEKEYHRIMPNAVKELLELLCGDEEYFQLEEIDEDTVSKNYKKLISKRTLINKNSLIHSIQISRDELFVSNSINCENGKCTIYNTINRKYLKILKYLDLSKIDFSNVDVRNIDFRGTNAKINPIKVYGNDISGCDLNEENIADDFNYFAGSKEEFSVLIFNRYCLDWHVNTRDCSVNGLVLKHRDFRRYYGK